MVRTSAASVGVILVSVTEGRSLAYTVVGGIPVRNYQAEVTLAPTANGTHIRWITSWTATTRGRLVWRSLRKLYPEIVDALATAAERRDSQNQQPESNPAP